MGLARRVLVETDFIKDLFLVNQAFGFLVDVARIAAGVALGAYIALRLTRRRGDGGTC